MVSNLNPHGMGCGHYTRKMFKNLCRSGHFIQLFSRKFDKLNPTQSPGWRLAIITFNVDLDISFISQWKICLLTSPYPIPLPWGSGFWQTLFSCADLDT